MGKKSKSSRSESTKKLKLSKIENIWTKPTKKKHKTNKPTHSTLDLPKPSQIQPPTDLWDVFEDYETPSFYDTFSQTSANSGKGQIFFCLPHEVRNTKTDIPTETRQMISHHKSSLALKLAEKESKISEENLASVKDTLNDIISKSVEKLQNEEDLVQVCETVDELLIKCQNREEQDLLQCLRNARKLKKNVLRKKKIFKRKVNRWLRSDKLLLTFYKALTNAEEESVASNNKLFETLERELSTEQRPRNGKTALWVSGVSEHVKACHLLGLFSLFGEIDDVKIVADAVPPNSKFYAYILMSRDEDAKKCIKYLNGVTFGGKRLHIKKTKTHLIYKKKITIEKEGQIPGVPAGEFPLLVQVKTKV